MSEAYKLEFYVPDTHTEKVKMAIFEAGAGKVGNYDCCSWQAVGKGQFRPCEGSNPFIGNKNMIETLVEVKVETLVPDEKIEAVIEALKDSHPYEMPAYQYWKVNTPDPVESVDEEDEEEFEDEEAEAEGDAQNVPS